MKAPRTSQVLRGLVLVLCTLLAYWPAVRGDFVWDDALYLRDNPLIKAGDGLRRFWLSTEFTDYYALSNTSFWLEWRLWGANPAGYHVTNILLHAFNAVLIWRLLRRLNIRAPWLAALVFALHPVNVMSVAWISERKNLLAMFFMLLTMMAYLRWDESRHRRTYGVALACFLLALLSKTAVVVLPVALLLILRWKHRRLERGDWVRVAPFFALAVALGAVTLWFEQHHGIKAEVVRTDSLFERLAVAGWAVWFYFGKALVPINLSVIYPRWNVPANTIVAYLPLLGLGLVAAVLWRFRPEWGRAPLFAFAYEVTMLLPVLGFFNIGFMSYSYVADHWQYFSIIAPIAIVCAAGVKMEEVWRWYWLPAAAAVIVFLLGWGTWQRAHVWRSEETLWQDTLERNPDAWMAHNNFGNALLRAGRLDEAIGHYRETLRRKPDYANAHYNLGIAYYQKGDTARAMSEFREVVRLKPQSAEAHNNLAAALTGVGDTNAAIAEFQTAARLAPQWSEPRDNLRKLGAAE